MIPSTKPPNWNNGSASRSLYCQSSTKSFSIESNPDQKSQNPNKNLAETGSVVNKGWNYISSAFTASSNFKTIGSKFENSQQRARSRDSLFPANHNSLCGSLDIPSIKTRSEKIMKSFLKKKHFFVCKKTLKYIYIYIYIKFFKWKLLSSPFFKIQYNFCIF